MERTPMRVTPNSVHSRLTKLGLNRKPGETARDQVIRLKSWLKKYGDILSDEIKEKL